MKISLANLEQATAQQVFDQVANHLLTQKQSCIVSLDNGGWSCAYRSADGKLACAAGCLLSDEDMSRVYEANINTGASWSAVAAHLDLTTKHMKLITKLQIIHDDEDPSEWKELLEQTAGEFELNTEALSAYISRL